ncbi:double-strand break repair protein MRE11-like [Bolinopsis microptera]|uniref:double-strand break repair protein MRE11-like n=1 Tax=Bolinopsis microptera TaxID=2820187 RepID=UPI0030792212
MTGDDDSQDPPEEESFSVLVATDTHLGYAEKDAIRGEDSFRAFEEVLQHAVDQQVDMILLGGDLFHDNKPSRTTVHKATTLLRKYCFGDKPIQIEFLSDQKANFHTSHFPRVNYEDPNLNVGIPVFSIHGNHDDPAGPQGLCALDLLSASGVINYFGKATSVDEIVINPLLMRKGPTKLAIYGLGSVRDERLHRMFLNNKVRVTRPEQDRDDWFNIFVIHQNHVKRGSQATSYIPEDFLPDFMDLVIWGHEHDCKPELEHNETINAYVLQPGSSVATSLSEGETLPKHCFKLKIWKKNFCLNKIPLTTVRPFIFKSVSLIDNDITADEKIHDFLQYHVNEMIERANELRGDNSNAPELPLIRLRYEYSGGTIPINGAKFGVDYLTQLANPRDILLSVKKKEYSSTDNKASARTGTLKEEGDEDENKGSTSRGDLALEIMKADNKEFKILFESCLGMASDDFVDKLENDSVNEYIDFAMERCEDYLKQKAKFGDDLTEKVRVRKAVMTKDDVADDCEEARRRTENRRLEKQARGESDERDVDRDSDPDALDLDDEKPARGRGRGRGRSRARANSTRGTARGKGSRGGGKGSRGGKGGVKTPKGNLDSFFSGTMATSSNASPSRVSSRSTKNTKLLEISDSD